MLLSEGKNDQFSSHAIDRGNAFKMLSSRIWIVYEHVFKTPRTEFDLNSNFRKFFEKSLDHPQEPILVRICLYSMYKENIRKNGRSTLFF